MNANQLSEIIRLHGLWLDGDMDGIRADLSYANLRSANLRSANLRSADLRYADLRYADLSDADLSGADLSYADLRSADLSDADLSGADLRYTVGDGSIIRTIQTGIYTVVICGPMVSIGCQSHNWSDWMGFNDILIRNMDGQKAIDFWRVWKPILTAIMEAR